MYKLTVVDMFKKKKVNNKDTCPYTNHNKRMPLLTIPTMQVS
jgi:hypothetical protein